VSWGVESCGGVVVSTGGVESLGDSFEASELPLLHPSAATEKDTRLPKSHAARRAPERAGIIGRPTHPSVTGSEHTTHYW